MPKTKFQNIIFTLIMAFIMVYAMICYNISLNKGQMSNEVFLLAFHEMVIMWPAAFILEFLAGGNILLFSPISFIKTCDKACIHIYKTGSGQSVLYHACDFVNDCMYYVSDNEYDCNIVV